MSLGAGDIAMNKTGSLSSGCLHFKEKSQGINSQTHGEVTGMTIIRKSQSRTAEPFGLSRW